MGARSASPVEILHLDRAHVEALAALIVAIEREAGGRSPEALASLGERVRRDLRASAFSPDAPSILLAASVEGTLIAYASCAGCGCWSVPTTTPREASTARPALRSARRCSASASCSLRARARARAPACAAASRGRHRER